MQTITIASSLNKGHSLDLRLVTGSEWEPVWDQLVHAHHYLGCRKLLGRRLKYMAFVQDESVAALSWSAPARQLGARDQFIGWDPQQRKRFLGRLAANSRFIIFPWVQVKNLASCVLARNLRHLRHDWKQRFQEDLWLVETFVDPRYFRGTVYKAANWRFLGSTQGYTKWGKGYLYHGRTKDVYVYVLETGLWDILGCSSTLHVTPRSKKVEELSMALQSGNWNPSLDFAEPDLEQEEVQTIAEELSSFHEEFSHCFGRSEQKRLGLGYIFGLLGDTQAKSAEPIALEYIGKPAVRSLQRFMKVSPWDHEAMLRTHQENMATYLSSPGGMITVDASEFEKKGTHSVGVARQYCGRLGKTENCQSGVFAGYTSEHGHCLVDCQLYMPKQWFSEDYKKLWEKNLIPEHVAFQTKPEIALQLIHRVKEFFPASWVGCDSAFGSDDNFLSSLPEGLWYFADVKGSEKVFLDEPEVGVPAYQGKGKPPTKERVLSGDLRRVSDIAKSDDISWQIVNLGEGAKGPLLARVACMRVYPSRNGFPKDEPVWLFIRKHFDGQTRYSFSNAPADISFEELCKASAMRWPIEQCFEEGKSHLGMDAYEHRSWPAWHRHMIYVMLAQQFLFRLRQRFKKNSRLESR